MPRYKRVALKDRYQIEALLRAGFNASEIARRLGFHKSTLYREIKRVQIGHYIAPRAESSARELAKDRGRQTIIRGRLQKIVREKLTLGWSPEQISYRALSESGKRVVSHETIYKFVRARLSTFPEMRNGLRKFRKKGSSRLARRKRPGWMRSIHERSISANSRSELGHWERDCLYAKNRSTLLVCLDRRSRLIKIIRPIKPACVHLTNQTRETLLATGKFLSLTNDNGSEFYDGNQFEVPVYYCDPRRPQQRGSVENAIGLIRQYITRQTNLDELTDEKLLEIENALNHRPRKCLDGLTPFEVFFETSVALVS